MSDKKNMSTEQRETRLRAVQLARRSPEPKPDVEVIALEIDEDFDLGGDPYNHTGSHCVVKLRDD